MKAVSSRVDALWGSRWIVDVNLISTMLRRIWPLSLFADTTSFLNVGLSVHCIVVFSCLAAVMLVC